MTKKSTFWLAVLMVAATTWIAHPAPTTAGNLVQNGSFETYAKAPGNWSVAGAIDFNLGTGNTDITGWTVTRGQIDYVQASSYTWKAADGNRSIDLCGTPGSGGVRQTFATTPGKTYQVRFAMSGNPTTGWSGEDQPNKTLRVQAAGQSADFSFDVAIEKNTLADMKWKPCTFTFVADSDSTTLEILSTMPPVHIGPVIDNVSVTLAPDWSPAGTYTGTNNQGEELLVTIIPLGPDNLRFAIVRDALNQNIGWEGRPISRGEIVKRDRDQYAVTLVAHVTDDNLKLLWRAVVSGTIVQTGEDTLETNLALSIYTPAQNPFAEGAEPFMCFPGVKDSLRRVPIVAPCVPAPSPDGR